MNKVLVFSVAAGALLITSTAGAQHSGRPAPTRSHLTRPTPRVIPRPRPVVTRSHTSRPRYVPPLTSPRRRVSSPLRASQSLVGDWSVAAIKAMAFWPTVWWGTYSALTRRPLKRDPGVIVRRPVTGGGSAHSGR